ncbi:MAG: hypothetical protein A2X11_08350 [Bacteroidetes bacterium GWE2_42_24]|nr:MAG: hypothetical protein A2X11_08350 [Bacteroidetes bacterium GWE2_42_24]OFY30965.1 MAG: hypothetical protein A2X09_17125 [Bacteroidetes bacterium GWF2_43_11]
MTIQSLSDTPVADIHSCFEKAFIDYAEPFDLTIPQLQYMIGRRGYAPDLSFGAFNNGTLVGFTLNGLGTWNGQKTVYDTGTGMIKEFRKQGLATRLFNDSLPVLRAAGVKQYLLEVIRTNQNAYDLYLKAGFTVTRQFEYYVMPVAQLELNNYQMDGLVIAETDNPDPVVFSSFQDFVPSWQNSVAAISRKSDYFKIFGAFFDNKLVGYGIIETHTGDIPQLAVAKEFRRRKVATILFNHLIREVNPPAVRFINVQHDYEPFNRWVEHLGLKAGYGQYEMMMKL